MSKCTGKRCPMQVGYKVNECNHKDCPYRTEPITNADRIRAMSDDELAKFIDDIAQSVADGEYCTAFLNVKNFPYSCEDAKKACVAHVVDWLKQPVE